MGNTQQFAARGTTNVTATLEGVTRSVHMLVVIDNNLIRQYLKPTNTDLSDLDTGNNALTTQVANETAAYLRNNRLSRIINGATIHDTTLQIILGALTENKALTALNLCFSYVGDENIY